MRRIGVGRSGSLLVGLMLSLTSNADSTTAEGTVIDSDAVVDVASEPVSESDQSALDDSLFPNWVSSSGDWLELQRDSFSASVMESAWRVLCPRRDEDRSLGKPDRWIGFIFVLWLEGLFE